MRVNNTFSDVYMELQLLRKEEGSSKNTIKITRLKEIVKRLIRDDGLVLEFVGAEFQNDRDIVELAIKSKPVVGAMKNRLSPLKFASYQLQQNEMLLALSIKNGANLGCETRAVLAPCRSPYFICSFSSHVIWSHFNSSFNI